MESSSTGGTSSGGGVGGGVGAGVGGANTIVIGNKRTLSPITDTSEEESQHDMNGTNNTANTTKPSNHPSTIVSYSSSSTTTTTLSNSSTPRVDEFVYARMFVEGPTYRGETFIENVERLPDGSSHLLLRIEDGDSNDLIDSSDPTRTCGKYKYRFKRIGAVSDRWPVVTGQEATTSDVSKQIVKSAIEKAIERVTTAVGDSDEETSSTATTTTTTEETENEFYTVVYTEQGLVRREASKTKHHVDTTTPTPTPTSQSIKKKLKVTVPKKK